jgi:hypothetical protein
VVRGQLTGAKSGQLRYGRCHGELDRDVAGLLGDPVDDGIGGHAGYPDETGLVVDEYKHVRPMEHSSVSTIDEGLALDYLVPEEVLLFDGMQG